jgi:hypothetical protein
MLKRDHIMFSSTNNYSTLDNEHNQEDLYLYSVKKSTNIALPITITESGEDRFSIRFLRMFHRRFANTPRALLCKSNQ